MKDDKGREMTYWGGSPPTGESKSSASACSGADARQADKADELEVWSQEKQDEIIEEYRLLTEAAVSPRSSDGLLPCPFCGCEPVSDPDETFGGRISCPDWDCPGHWSLCLYDFESGKSRWNTRAAMAKPNNTDE